MTEARVHLPKKDNVTASQALALVDALALALEAFLVIKESHPPKEIRDLLNETIETISTRLYAAGE